MSEFKQRVGRRIAEAREAKGWTQVQLARLLPTSVDGANVPFHVGLPCARSSSSDRLYFKRRPADCTTVMTGYGLAGMVRLRDIRWTGWRRSVATGRGTRLSTRAGVPPWPVTVHASRRRLACNGVDDYYSRLRLPHGRSVWVAPSCEGDYLLGTFRRAMLAWPAAGGYADHDAHVESASCDFGAPGVWRCRGEMTTVVDRRVDDLVRVGERCRYRFAVRTAGYAIHKVHPASGCETA